MRNILLQKDKKRLYREYQFRIIIVVLTFMLFTMIGSFVLLTPSYLVSKYKESNTLEYANIIKKSVEIQEKSIFSSILNDTKIKLQLLAGNEGDVSFEDTIKTIVKNKPIGVKINSFSYTKNNENQQETTITGTASERGILLKFQKDLQNESIFSDIVLPISNLAADRDIRFSMKIITNF